MDDSWTCALYRSPMADPVKALLAVASFSRNTSVPQSKKWFSNVSRSAKTVLVGLHIFSDLNPNQHLGDVPDQQVSSPEAPPRNAPVLKSLLLTTWCQIPQRSFRGLGEAVLRWVTGSFSSRSRRAMYILMFSALECVCFYTVHFSPAATSKHKE